MDVLLRDVDPIVIKKFDELAKKRKVSRQEFLKSILTRLASAPEIGEREKRFEYLVSKNIETMEIMTAKFENLEKKMKELTGG